MKNILTCLFATVCLHFYSQSLSWVNTFGSVKDEIVYSVALDNQGNIYSTGYFTGPTDFDSGPGTFMLSGDNDTSSVFIRKTDSNGNFIWAKEIKSVTTWTSSEVSISIDNQNRIYIAGHYFHKVDFNPGANTHFLYTQLDEHSGFILSLDESGNFRWAKCLNDKSGMAFSVCNNSGNVYIGGSFAGINDFDPGPATYTLDGGNYYNACVTKLDSTGNFHWAIGFGGTDLEQLKCVKTDAAGNVYVAGYYRSVNADFDPGAGSVTMPPMGEDDIFFCKFNPQGGLVWVKQIGGSLNEQATAIAVDNSGFVYITGYFENQTDFDPDTSSYLLTTTNYYNPFISKYDNDGNLVWAKQISGQDIGMGTAITLQPGTGNIFTTGFMRDIADFDPGSGTYTLTSNGGTDIFLSQLDNNGNFICASTIGAAGYDVGYSAVSDNSGNVLIAGRFYGSFDFDPGILTQTVSSVGSYDGFVAKYSSCEINTDLVKNSPVNVSIFPNPISGFLYIKTEKNEKSVIYIRNILGQVVYSDSFEDEHKIDLTMLNEGIYFAEVSQSAHTRILKIIKKD